MLTAPRAAVITAALAAGCALALAVRADGQSPPPAPDSTQSIGADQCATCHETETKSFPRSPHGALAPHELGGRPGGCDSCHGPGAKHADSGEIADIRAFSTLSGHDASRACTTCHLQDQASHWPGSEHATSEVSCTSCHRIHQSRKLSRVMSAAEGAPHTDAPPLKASLVRQEPELCLGCHKEKRGRINASSHHPIREGRMTCSSCHDVHGTGQGNSLIKSTERKNDLCFTCHTKHQGPFIFEHAPVEEDCTTCHDPHGTVANNLLKQGEPFLCLQCHEMHFHNARLAPATPFSLPAGGSLNPNGASGFQRAFGTRCTTCHTRIHGSDNASQGVSGGGKALIR